MSAGVQALDAMARPADGRARDGAGARLDVRRATLPALWPLLLALAGLAAAAPLWVSRLLPFQDAPQHLAAIRVLADYADPRFDFARWFVIDLRHSQYIAFYLPAALLARLVGPDAACRLVLSAVALALPAAAWALLSAFGRDRRLAVFAPAVFHTAPLYLGFFNFVMSVPVLLYAVALTERELQQPSLRRAAGLAVLATLLLWIHPSAVALLLFAAVLLALSAGKPPRALVRGLAPLLPAALALLGFLAVASLPSSAEASRRHPVVWQPFREQLLDLARFGNVLAGHADEVFVGALALLWLAAALLPGAPGRAPRSFRLPLLAVATLALYLVAPFGVGYVGFIPLRTLPFLALVTLSAPRLAPGRATSALLACAVVLQLVWAAKLCAVYRAFDAEAQTPQLEQVLRAAAPGKRLLALIYDRQSSIAQFQSYLHFGMYYQVERGGRARFSFSEYPWSPVRFRPGTEPEPLPPYYEGHPEQFDASREGRDTDYLLVRGQGPAPGPAFTLAAQQGRWSLYARRP